MNQSLLQYSEPSSLTSQTLILFPHISLTSSERVAGTWPKFISTTEKVKWLATFLIEQNKLLASLDADILMIPIQWSTLEPSYLWGAWHRHREGTMAILWHESEGIEIKMGPKSHHAAPSVETRTNMGNHHHGSTSYQWLWPTVGHHHCVLPARVHPLDIENAESWASEFKWWGQQSNAELLFCNLLKDKMNQLGQDVGASTGWRW